MRRALNLLRRAVHYRHDAFQEGLHAAGFTTVSTLPDPKKGDLLLIWNRYGAFHETALHFERVGATVLVAENGILGNDWLGRNWYSLALEYPAIAGGSFNPSGPERWELFKSLTPLAASLKEWNVNGQELIILEQRGIGSAKTASPPNWAESIKARFGGRIRRHPGTGAIVPPLEEDLKNAKAVITWASAAAIQALYLGVPVWYRHENFVGAKCARHIAEFDKVGLLTDSHKRQEMFEDISWAIWQLDEIRSGYPIARLVGA